MTLLHISLGARGVQWWSHMVSLVAVTRGVTAAAVLCIAQTAAEVLSSCRCMGSCNELSRDDCLSLYHQQFAAGCSTWMVCLPTRCCSMSHSIHNVHICSTGVHTGSCLEALPAPLSASQEAAAALPANSCQVSRCSWQVRVAAARERHLNLTQKAKLLGDDARTAEFEATQMEAGGSLQLDDLQASGEGSTSCPCVRQAPFPSHTFPLKDAAVARHPSGLVCCWPSCMLAAQKGSDTPSLLKHTVWETAHSLNGARLC